MTLKIQKLVNSESPISKIIENRMKVYIKMKIKIIMKNT